MNRFFFRFFCQVFFCFFKEVLFSEIFQFLPEENITSKTVTFSNKRLSKQSFFFRTENNFYFIVFFEVAVSLKRFLIIMVFLLKRKVFLKKLFLD